MDVSGGSERGTPPLITRPTFLAGCVRSGTTLLRLMLDHHPLVDFLHEFEFAVDLVGDDGRFPHMEFLYEYLEADRIFLDSGLVIDRGLDFPALLNSFLRQRRDRKGKPLVGATVHAHFHRLLFVWPEARFIHLVRDGRDVSRSIVEQGWAGNAYEAAQMWIDAELSWADLSRMLPADRWVDVKYEGLIRQPEATLARLCAFLGVPYDPAMLDYPRDTTYGPPSPHLIDQWRRMPPAEVSLVESRVAAMLIRRGYALSGRPLPTVSPRQRERIRRQHRWTRAVFRLRRYGLILFMAELLARRFGFQGLQKRMAPRMNAIDRKYLK